MIFSPQANSERKISRCIAQNDGKACNFLSQTKVGHEHKGSFIEGTLAVLITFGNSDAIFLTGTEALDMHFPEETQKKCRINIAGA
jgi:hypothetical protein